MSAPAPETLITKYLEMTHPAEFVPAFVRLPNVRVERVRNDDVAFYRFLYASVGEKWRWRDRLALSDEQLAAALRSAVILVLYVDHTPAGYVELVKRGAAMSIEYFGLREMYQGMGLGKHLLSAGIQRAWEMGAERLIVHTCNLDSPHALANYEKRGFRVVRETQEPMPPAYF